jgi:hypothetical protein
MGLAGRLGISLAILAGWGLWTWLALRRLSALSWFPFLKWLIPAAAFTFAVLALLGGAPVDARLAFATAAATLAALLSLAVALAAAGAKFVTTLIAGVHTNFYGMCSGRTMRAGDGDGLTDWLTGYFDALAGPRPGNHPLTFGDLWGDAAAADGDPRERQINLEVMTTAISQQLCYSIPFREGTPALYYDEQEWERLFPPAVMACLKDARRAAAGDDEVPIPVVSAAGRRLRRLPANRDLPVVVAVRMSLSFPILLSAVPLYAIDWSRTHNQTARERARTQADSGGEGESVTLTATRVWFSDGGIASNMPLHFFDAPLPGHPTFAVNLKKPHPDHPVDAGGRVYLPDSNVGGRLRYWPEPSDTAPARGLIGFLLGIVNTMQNWRDEIQFPYPGYRDRIVQISQRDDEGGLNLNMPEKHITALSDAGETAAQVLIDRFHPAGAQAAEGWANHEEVRLTTFLGLIERMGLSLHARLADGTWADVTARVVAIGRYSERDGERANTYLDGLRALGDAMQDGPGLADKALKPRAELRISPRI